jgi:tetratricopeptide (TPR) repeat protein
MQKILQSDSTAKQKVKDKLNLYLIGHSPDVKYLKRLLSQVKPIVKSLSFVCTDEENDCLEVIEDSGIPYEFERITFSDRQDFDFSLVRNKARDMASKHAGWAFWLDCDDTIDNPEKILEEMEANAGKDAYALPYDVSEKAGNLYKLRIHKKDWEWQNKVHEEIIPKNGEKREVLVLSDCPVKHSPDEGKSNHDFHISLLKKNISTSEADYTYLAKEYFNSLKIDEAIPYIKKAIAIHSYPHEIYNLWNMLGVCYGIKDKSDNAIKSFQSAILVAPYRKEAYFHLAELYGKLGETDNLKNGFGYICACTNQLDFGEPLQNTDIYNITGYLLHARYLQKFNKYREALKMLDNIKSECPEADIIKKELEDASTE